LIEFALTLPMSLKLRGEEGKYAFKRAFEDLRPEEARIDASPESAWSRRGCSATTCAPCRSCRRKPESLLSAWLDQNEVGNRVRDYYSGQGGFSGAQCGAS
jgi:hypothetical protein